MTAPFFADIADAVAASLTAAAETLGFEFTADRRWIPDTEYTPEEFKAHFDTLRISVIPGSPITSEQESRKTKIQTVPMIVGVQQMVKSSANADVDPLAKLVSDIADFCIGKKFGSNPEAACTGTEISPALSVKDLEQYKLFTGIVRLTLKARRPG